MQRSHKKEQRTIDSRGKFLIYFCLSLFIILFSRLSYLQLANNDKYQSIRNKNVVKTNFISPKRGLIYDRNGVEIAGNRGLFSIAVVPEKLQGFTKDKEKVATEFIDEIAKIIDIPKKEQARIIKKMRYSPLFTETIIKSDLSTEELAAITSNRKYFDAININSTSVRNYKDGAYYLNVLGYVGKVSKNDLNDPNVFVTNLDYVGKKGIERLKNKELLGTHGKEMLAINAYGKVMSREKVINPINGKSVTLTIDDDLQTLAYKLLGDEHGAIVALDPNNGDVLALASTPTYDPNKLIKGITNKEYKETFLNSSSSPFFNRAISGQYSPASTLKPFISMAGLLGRWIDPDKKVWCGPFYQIKGSSRHFNDWKKSGHGWVNMRHALEVSADVYYYKLGQEMGIDYIHDVLSYFNFGEKTNIDLKGELSGLNPSTKWKKEAKKEAWYTGETLISSIGQGFMMATPLQLAQATAILVNGGKDYKPKLILDEKTKLVKEIKIPEKYTEEIKEGMRDVIFGAHGTARKWRYKKYGEIVRYQQGGKTGTSQVYSTKGERPDKNVELPKNLRDHAIYIGFAPYKNPKIVVSVVIENVGGGSTHAAPIGMKIMQAYLDKHYPETSIKATENKAEMDAKIGQHKNELTKRIVNEK